MIYVWIFIKAIWDAIKRDIGVAEMQQDILAPMYISEVQTNICEIQSLKVCDTFTPTKFYNYFRSIIYI